MIVETDGSMERHNSEDRNIEDPRAFCWDSNMDHKVPHIKSNGGVLLMALKNWPRRCMQGKRYNGFNFKSTSLLPTCPQPPTITNSLPSFFLFFSPHSLTIPSHS